MSNKPLFPVNAKVEKEFLDFNTKHMPTLVATLNKDGGIKELERVRNQAEFQIDDNTKRLAIREFQQALSYYGFRSKVLGVGCIEITKDIFKMQLNLDGLLPFSDVTLGQINSVYDSYIAEHKDTCHRMVSEYRGRLAEVYIDGKSMDGVLEVINFTAPTFK